MGAVLAWMPIILHDGAIILLCLIPSGMWAGIGAGVGLHYKHKHDGGHHRRDITAGPHDYGPRRRSNTPLLDRIRQDDPLQPKVCRIPVSASSTVGYLTALIVSGLCPVSRQRRRSGATSSRQVHVYQELGSDNMCMKKDEYQLVAPFRETND